jgi:hypothetical protein
MILMQHPRKINDVGAPIALTQEMIYRPYKKNKSFEKFVRSSRDTQPFYQESFRYDKFSDKEDTGYKRVRDQLWLWDNTTSHEGGCESSLQHGRTSSHRGIEQPQDGQARTDQVSDGDRPAPAAERSVSSNGGAIFIGNVSAGRDFKYRG